MGESGVVRAYLGPPALPGGPDGMKGASRRRPSSGSVGSGPSRRPSTESFSPRIAPNLVQLPLVEVDVPAGTAGHWSRDVTERWNLRVRLNVCRPMGVDASRLLQVAELTGDPGDLAAAERYLRHRDDLLELTVMVLSPSRRFVRTVTRMPESCRRIFEGGVICATCQFLPADGSEVPDRWTLVLPRAPGALKSVVRSLGQGDDPRPPILRMRRFVPPQTLTARQATALETAYRLGFYAFPRRTNLKELSRILGVSRSTASELLRRAESKMLAPHLGER